MKISITIAGKEYPCRQTMGAMLRFKRETGKEVTEITDSVTDMLTFMYCCAESCCKTEGVEFGMTLEDFADRLDISDVTGWAAQFDNGQPAADAEKKTRP